MYFNKTITPYLAKKDGYYLGNCVSKKSPPHLPKIINVYRAKKDGYLK